MTRKKMQKMSGNKEKPKSLLVLSLHLDFFTSSSLHLL